MESSGSDARITRRPCSGSDSGDNGFVTDLPLVALAYLPAPGPDRALWEAILAELGAPVRAGELAGIVVDREERGLIRRHEVDIVTRFELIDRHPVLFGRARRDLAWFDRQAVLRAMVHSGRDGGWSDTYILRELPALAAETDLLDELIGDDDFLLRADLRRLRPLAGWASSPRARERERLIRLTPHADAVEPAERAAMLHLSATIDGVDFPTGPLYRPLWTITARRLEWAVIDGGTHWLRSMCRLHVNGRDLLATGGDDGQIRLWDPATRMLVRTLRGHESNVAALCAAGPLLASAGQDCTVRLWDPATGRGLRTMTAGWHVEGLVCVSDGAGRVGLAARAYDTVTVWDPSTGEEIARAELPDHARLFVLEAVTVDGRPALEIGDLDGTVARVDPFTGARLGSTFRRERRTGPATTLDVGGREVHVTAKGATIRVFKRSLPGHSGAVKALCQVEVHGHAMLASCGTDGTLRLWDVFDAVPATEPTACSAVCAVTVDGVELLACGGDDKTVRLRDPATGTEHRVLRGHTDLVTALRAVTVAGRQLLASAGLDSTIRVWDPHTGRQLRVIGCALPYWLGVLPMKGREVLVSGGGDRAVRLWDPSTGRGVTVRREPVESRWGRLAGPLARFRGSAGPKGGLFSLNTVEFGGRHLLVTARYDGPLDQWHLTGLRSSAPTLTGHDREVWATCTVRVGDRDLLVSAGTDFTVRLWYPLTGQPHSVLRGHTDWVRAVCTHVVDGRTLIVSGGDDRTARLWDPATTLT